jgi:hypothetical protein
MKTTTNPVKNILSLKAVTHKILLLILALAPLALNLSVINEAKADFWVATGSMNTARAYHTATLLPNGKLLVAGGTDNSNNVLRSAELYDPATGTWTAPNAMTIAREYHTATLLPSGKVLVTGGFTNNLLGEYGQFATKSAELYDPATGTWTATNTLLLQRYNHTATLLSNGKVLVAGGLIEYEECNPDAELYDPATGTWTATNALNTPRYCHTATLLSNGKVLVAGGQGESGACTSSAELYDPATGTWTATNSMTTARTYHTATLLPNGKVLVAGGQGSTGNSLSTVELFDPATGTWTATNSMTTARANHTATLLPTGKLLVSGGQGTGSNYLSSAELYDPATGTWTATNSLNTARDLHTATLLSDGMVLVAGGQGSGGSYLSSAELYQIVNAWINSSDGKWETAADWSLAVAPSSSDASDVITNAGKKTVTIDATTSGSFLSTLTINNLTVSAPGGSTNTLFLNNAGTNTPLQVLGVLTLGTDGAMVVSNSAVLATNGTGTGSVVVNGGSLVLGAATFKTDNLVVTNGGVVQQPQTYQVNNASVTVASGTSQFGSLVVGSSANSTGVVAVTGGQLVVTNGVIGVGNDGTTNGSGSGSLTVSNGTVLAASILLGSSTGGSGDLKIRQGGTVTVLGGVKLNDGEVDPGGTLQVLYNPTGFAFEDSNLHNRIVAGYQRDGALNVYGGTVTAPEIIIGLNAGTGSLNLTNGSITTSNLIVGMNLSATGMVTIAGGTLTATDGVVQIGPAGNGQMTIAGGSLIARTIQLGGPGGSGQVLFTAGHVKTSQLIPNWWVGDGGDLDGCGGTMIIGGAGHDAEFDMHGGSATNFGAMYVGCGPVSENSNLRILRSYGSLGMNPDDDETPTGTYLQDGGLTVVMTNVVIGDCASNTAGVATLSGSGFLYVTNAAHNAVLDVRLGSFTMSGGSLIVDILRVTNGCGGTFTRTGGALQYGQLDLDPNQSAAGDGIPNGWKQQYGFDPFDPTVASADPDHDGANNLAEYLAGTNPTNAASVFRMVSVVKTNAQDLRVDWTTVGGHSYVVQTNGNLKTGAFNDLSPVISAGGTGEGRTNYVHAGAATNRANFYRVRLGP